MLFGHGGDVYSLGRELGIEPESVLDFSSNCSPLPYPGGFGRYLSERIDQMHLLPEVDSYSIRVLLSERYDLSPDSFLIGNGTTQWIYALPHVLKAKRALIPLPTYSDYQDACKSAGLEVAYLGPYPDGSPESTRLFIQDLFSLKGGDTRNCIIFICNPNNPTGLFIEPGQLIELMERCPDATWVIDEAYAPFVLEDERSSIITRQIPGNAVVLRSFSKIYGIPGLRIGCLAASPGSAAISRLRSRERPWAVNRMAQLAVQFLLNLPEYEHEVRQCCLQEKERLVSGLKGIDGLEYLEGRTHFALFRVSRPLSAERLCRALGSRGILIRNCANFKGLAGDHVRISPRLKQDNLKLIGAFRGLIPGQ